MLTWNIIAFVNIKFRMVIRDCGECRQVLQPPVWFYLRRAADVKDTARIHAQALRPMGNAAVGKHPRAPRSTITKDAATAELPTDISQRHIEVASQDPNFVLYHVLRQSIPERVQYFWPLHLHGAVVAMHSAHDDLFPKMANVLLEVNSGHYHPRPRHFVFFFSR